MADYYSNAFLTISATSSPNPTSPFLHTVREEKYGSHPFPITLPESEAKTVLYARLSTIFMSDEKRSHVDHYGPLVSRGWTWQEAALSTRNLHFCRSQLWWECKTHVVPECALDGKVSRRFEQAKTIINAKDDPFAYWTKAVEEYS
jgi:hypothetical protein